MLFFGTATWVLALVTLAITVAASLLGVIVGRRVRARSDTLREPFAVLQTTLLGFMALVLAFGLSLAVGRYEARRAAVVDESNAIGTSYLRAQTLVEPFRTRSLTLFKPYTDVSIRIATIRPGSAQQQQAVTASGTLQGRLWALATDAMNAAPTASAPRLYMDSLNETFDTQSRRVYGLGDRVPTPVLLLEVVGAAVALGALALYLGIIGRSAFSVLAAAVLVTGMLTITLDLDRPTRGLIVVPAKPLVQVRASMDTPPVAGPGSTTLR